LQRAKASKKALRYISSVSLLRFLKSCESCSQILEELRLEIFEVCGATKCAALISAALDLYIGDSTHAITDGTCRLSASRQVSDIRLRRAQALAHHSGAAFRISRELIDRKLAGQERVASEHLKDAAISTPLQQIRSELAEVETMDEIRSVELRAAKVYWKAWRAVTSKFPDKDLPRIPEHWRIFGSRASALSGSPRLAVNPVNAILNYLYALLEAECRLAIAALGLDPEMGVLHMDTINRDSLACDLMEAIRPDVDAYVLDRILKQPLKKTGFSKSATETAV
jgi:CRISPR-associated endonuclease Cas1